MTQQVRIFGLRLAPSRFAVVSTCSFAFALTAGGGWFPTAQAGSPPLDMLFSAQALSLGLLIGAAWFLQAGVQNWRPAWTPKAFVFNAGVLGSYVGHQVLPLFLGGHW